MRLPAATVLGVKLLFGVVKTFVIDAFAFRFVTPVGKQGVPIPLMGFLHEFDKILGLIAPNEPTPNKLLLTWLNPEDCKAGLAPPDVPEALNRTSPPALIDSPEETPVSTPVSALNFSNDSDLIAELTTDKLFAVVSEAEKVIGSPIVADCVMMAALTPDEPIASERAVNASLLIDLFR